MITEKQKKTDGHEIALQHSTGMIDRLAALDSPKDAVDLLFAEPAPNGVSISQWNRARMPMLMCVLKCSGSYENVDIASTLLAAVLVSKGEELEKQKN